MKKLAKYTTFQMGGIPYLFQEIYTPHDIEIADTISKEHSIPLIVLGGGSNIIFDTNPIHSLVAQMKIKGCKIVKKDSHYAWIQIGAGVIWDDAVLFSIQHNLSGIEALSAIPGTAGATPVQNVGAYGVEIKDVLDSVTVFDRDTSQWKTITPKQCRLSYRWSVFKAHPQRYIISSLILKLSRKEPLLPHYKKLQDLFREKSTPLTSQTLRSAVIELRSLSLPDPKTLPNAGSFFKNPIISSKKEALIRKKYPSLVSFPLEDGQHKLAAGWLIDQCGLKGLKQGHFSTYEKNALIIIHDGKGTFSELEAFILHIKEEVKKTFGVTLEPEPVFVQSQHSIH